MREGEGEGGLATAPGLTHDGCGFLLQATIGKTKLPSQCWHTGSTQVE